MRTLKMTIQVWTGLMHTLKKLQIDRFSTILKFLTVSVVGYLFSDLTFCVVTLNMALLARRR